MALTSYMLGGILDELASPRAFCPGSVFDQNFGLGVLHDDLVHPQLTAPLLVGYVRPWRHETCRKSGVSNIENNQDGFKVNLDVQQFKPSEISVKMVDNFVVIEGKHEERQDQHGYISRQFQRRYQVPDDVDPDSMVSKLSSDGVLSIEAPKKIAEPLSKERVIQITHTNAPAVTSAPKSVSEKKAANEQNGGETMDQ